MNQLVAAVLYIGFFGLIAFTVWFTGSAWALLALILTPSYTSK